MNITKRLNQIVEKSYEYDTPTAGVVLTKEQLAFIAGAAWADKTMIEKVGELLQDNFIQRDANGEIVSMADYPTLESFIDKFNDAMLEEQL